MNQVHISKAKLIKPESVALVAYSMQFSFGIPFEALIFEEVNVQVLKPLFVKYVSYFHDSKNNVKLEVSILQANLDKSENNNCSMLLTRAFVNGVCNEDSITITHFYMHPWNRDVVVKALASHPEFLSGQHQKQKLH